ncbi:ferritin-like domain-containing protein [Hymenobacter terricola]|uniref:ferritin-like domain-containing protein n=1 Tax=Hymenobacter terricola TaxID=2819236 RepID=UPI001B3070F0|nr:ferritin-like domain-containing protein [Hymenobacter terricola]
MSDHSFLSAWREQSLGRRLFLRVSAASAASVTLVAAGCSTSTPEPTAVDPYQLTLPAGDPGLLYYAYFLALTQAALYQKVTDTPPADLTAAERVIFADLRDHEVIYRETIKYVIDPTGATVLLPTDFAINLTSFTLTTRAGVLAAAQLLEDLTAAAYPTILPLFTSANIPQRTLLLKISSVQARHAATVRDLLTPGSFASSDVVENTGALAGQLRTKTPTEVMTAFAPYFAPYVITVANLAVPV